MIDYNYFKFGFTHIYFLFSKLFLSSQEGGVVGYGLGCAGVEESGGGGECEFAEVYFVVEGCV